ncbi:MAG: hypothetical protein CL609_13125 [Anaerolineaceae bacterium]|nr:hypothetical protein [Anaerolineaceae bacterium]
MVMSDPLNFSGRAFLSYLTELKTLVGEQSVKMILRKSGWLDQVRIIVSTKHDKKAPYQAILDINREIEEIFGQNAQKTVVFASARKSFVYSYANFVEIQETKAWIAKHPESTLRLRTALQVIIYVLEQTTMQKIQLQESSSHYHLTFDHSMVASDQKEHKQPHCFFLVGMIRGGLNYLFDADLYPVQELSCVSAGDHQCEFTVRKFQFSDYEKGTGKTGFLTLPTHLR